MTTIRPNVRRSPAAKWTATYPIWVEPNTLKHWLRVGAVWVTETGDENTYCQDQFGLTFFAKLEG